MKPTVHTFRGMAAALAMASMSAPAFAVTPDEVLADPALEARARALSAQLRCLVCQNQSIDDSDAPLAKDLRVLVRKRLQANDSDGQVMDYIVARYGDFVLLKPPVKGTTLLLWLAPLLALVGAIWLVLRSGLWRTTPRSEPATQLSAEEERKLKELLDRS